MISSPRNLQPVVQKIVSFPTSSALGCSGQPGLIVGGMTGAGFSKVVYVHGKVVLEEFATMTTDEWVHTVRS
jgi:hypothetical protein